MTGRLIPLGKSVKVKDGKIVRVHRFAVGQRKKIEGKAKRQADAWTKKGKTK